MATQAETIREIVVNLLKDSSLKTQINENLYGIRYNDLRKHLLKSGEYKFTDGAVTSALYTLPERVANVHRTKTHNGTYFYYSEENESEFDVTLSSVTTSIDYQDLLNMAKSTENKVGDILRKASQGVFQETSELDIKHLRQILNLTNQLNNALKSYEAEKSFELIEKLNQEKNGYDVLPF